MANENIDPKQLRDAYDLYKQLALASGDFNQNTKETLSDLKKVASAIEKIKASYDTTLNSVLDIKRIEKDGLELAKKRKITEDRLSKINDDIKESAKQIIEREKDLVEKIKKKELEISKLILAENSKGAEVYKTQLEFLRRGLDLLNQSIDATQAEALALFKIEESLNKQQGYNDGLLDRAKEAETIREKELRVSDKIAGKLKDRLGILDNYYTELNEKIDKAIDGEIKLTDINRWEILGKSIKKALLDPVIQFTLVLKAQTAVWNGIKKAFSFIVDIAKKAYTLLTGWNTQIFEFAKNLGIGEKAARGLQNSFLDMANTSGNLYFNTKELREAYTALTEVTGLFLENNKETTETAAILQRQFGLTSQHLGSIVENSAISGKSFKDTYYTINSIRIIEGSRNKTLMSQRQMMDEISKLSSVVLINFKGNVPALAAAVVKAKALGIDLNTIVETSKGFLDFESSISKEFEAQLFTGKDLNLQRLRYLSMTNDTAGLMAEIGKRIPSIVAYEKMNAYERETYAEALNMSSEALADIIKKQELNRKYGIAENATAGETYKHLVQQGMSHAQIVDILGKQAAEQDKSASIADRWNSIVENIKDTLGQMLEGEMGNIIKAFQDLVKNSGGIQGIMEKIRSVAHSVADFFRNIPEAIDKIVKKAVFILDIAAAAQAIIGSALLFTPAAAAGAGLLVGAAKTEALALALRAGNSVTQDFMKPTTVGGAAAAAQVSSTRVASTSSNSNSSNSASTVAFTLNTVNSYDGQRSAPVVKKYFFGPSGDNVTGEFGKEHNISIGGS